MPLPLGRHSLGAETTDPQNTSAWKTNYLRNQLKYCFQESKTSQTTQLPEYVKGQVKETCDPRTFKHRERSSQGGFRGAVGPNTRAVLNWI